MQKIFNVMFALDWIACINVDDILVLYYYWQYEYNVENMIVMLMFFKRLEMKYQILRKMKFKVWQENYRHCKNIFSGDREEMTFEDRSLEAANVSSHL